MKADHPDMPVAQWAEEVLGLDLREEEPPHPGGLVWRRRRGAGRMPGFPDRP